MLPLTESHCKLFAHEERCELFLSASEHHHHLLAEVLDEGTFGKWLRHIAHLITGLLGEHCAGAGKDSNTNEHGELGHRDVWL